MEIGIGNRCEGLLPCTPKVTSEKTGNSPGYETNFAAVCIHHYLNLKYIEFLKLAGRCIHIIAPDIVCK